MFYLRSCRSSLVNSFKISGGTFCKNFGGNFRFFFFSEPQIKAQEVLGNWEKLSRGVSKPGCFPLFSGKVQIMSRTLSGLFLVGALNRPRKRKGTNRENPRTLPEQIGKIPEKDKKGQKRTKKDKKGQKSPDRETPPFETPPFSGS